MHHDIYEFKLRQFHGNPNSCKSYFDSCRKYITNVEFIYLRKTLNVICFLSFDNGVQFKLSVAGI